MIKSENSMIKILLKYFSVLLVLTFIEACSELNTDIPSVPKVSIHGDSLYSPT